MAKRKVSHPAVSRQGPYTYQVWLEGEIECLRKLYADTPTKELARLLGHTHSVVAILAKAKKLGLKKRGQSGKGPAWNPADMEQLRRLYADTPAKEIARLLGRPVHGIHHKADSLGLKSNLYFGSPIGSTRTQKGGYLQRKISKTGNEHQDWVGLHVLLWQEAHGPIPANHCLRFKDGNSQHVELENLELVSRGENMARNSIQRFPPELIKTIRLACRLRRKIKEKTDEEQAD
jgi:hypothetical protein